MLQMVTSLEKAYYPSVYYGLSTTSITQGMWYMHCMSNANGDYCTHNNIPLGSCSLDAAADYAPLSIAFSLIQCPIMIWIA
jgi:hypothetical protein